MKTLSLPAVPDLSPTGRVGPRLRDSIPPAVRDFGARLCFPEEDLPLLIRAFTHRSVPEAGHGDNNERLEFLGDSVLALVVNEYLYEHYPQYAEGQLTRLKSRYVSVAPVAEAARSLRLGELLTLGQGDEQMGGRRRPSTLCNTFEAVLGALYLSRGLEAAREFVERELIARVDPAVLTDFKSVLQEKIQEQLRLTPRYQTGNVGGPAHDPVFLSTVLVGEEELGKGQGGNKKQAEQAAAQAALEQLGLTDAR